MQIISFFGLKNRSNPRLLAQELHGCDRTKVPFRQLCPREVRQLMRVLEVLRQMLLEAGVGKGIMCPLVI